MSERDRLAEIRSIMEQHNVLSLGAHTSPSFESDPRHLVFTLSRYKFVAKMFDGFASVAEVGCGDGFGSTIVAQSVGQIDGYDIEQYALEHRAQNKVLDAKMTFHQRDLLQEPLSGNYNGIFSLDVIEHIDPKSEAQFLRNICTGLAPHGCLIIGTPNATAEPYASEPSKIGHVNWKSFASLRQSMQACFENVFMFGMNDEVVHTGYGPMCHYLFALGVAPKRL